MQKIVANALLNIFWKNKFERKQIIIVLYLKIYFYFRYFIEEYF